MSWDKEMHDQMDIPPNMLEDRVRKLPVWAREEREGLLRKVQELTRRNTHLEEERSLQVSADPKPRIVWRYLRDEVEHGIPKYADVQFHFDREYGVYVSLRWNEFDQVIEINGTESLGILPIATNRIQISTKKR